MEQEGIHYYFKHAKGSHTLVLADGDSSHPTFPGYADMSFHQAGRGVVNVQGITRVDDGSGSAAGQLRPQ